MSSLGSGATLKEASLKLNIGRKSVAGSDEISDLFQMEHTLSEPLLTLVITKKLRYLCVILILPLHKLSYLWQPINAKQLSPETFHF